MKIVLQRVKEALVEISGQTKAAIGKGFVLFVGIDERDTFETAAFLAKKVSGFRVFEDKQGKMNLNIVEAQGEVLSIPQFTLLARTKKGNRPSFDDAADVKKAETLWKKFNQELCSMRIQVLEGEFGAKMLIKLINDGPVTFILEKET